MAYAALALAIFVWGLEYPLMKSATAALGPLGTGAVMFSGATLILGLQLGMRGEFRRARLPDHRVFGQMLLIGLIGFFLNVAALLAMRLTSVTNVATLARTDILFSLVLAALFFHEAIERTAWFALPLMLGGICLLTGIFTTPFGMGSVGDGLVLLSAFLVALNAFLIRHVTQRADPSLVGFVNTGVNSILFLTAILVLSPRGEALPALGVAFRHPVALVLGGLAALFFMSYYVALRTLPVWKVRLLMLLIPVVAAVAGWIWLSEAITMVKALGMALVCAGAAGVILVKHMAQLSKNTQPVGKTTCKAM